MQGLPRLRAFVAALNASAAAQGDSLGTAARRFPPFTVPAHTMRIIHFDFLASRQPAASRLSESSTYLPHHVLGKTPGRCDALSGHNTSDLTDASTRTASAPVLL